MDVSAVKTQPAQPSQQVKRADEVQQVQKREAQEKENNAKATQQAQAKPVVNTQGQTTGRILNATA